MDIDIIKKVLNGDINQFNSLINKYYNELFKYAYNQFEDVEETKDVLQEIFMRLYNNLNKYNPEKASFRTWMYRVATNYCINYRRKLKFTIKDYDFSRVSSTEDIVENLIQHEQVDLAISIMKKNLSKKQYQIMILYFFSDLAHKDIADVMNLQPKTIRNIVSESVKKIKEIVRRDTHDDL